MLGLSWLSLQFIFCTMRDASLVRWVFKQIIVAALMLLQIALVVIILRFLSGWGYRKRAQQIEPRYRLRGGWSGVCNWVIVESWAHGVSIQWVFKRKRSRQDLIAVLMIKSGCSHWIPGRKLVFIYLIYPSEEVVDDEEGDPHRIEPDVIEIHRCISRRSAAFVVVEGALCPRRSSSRICFSKAPHRHCGTAFLPT